LEDDDFQSADIFILPPEDPTRSDEDSGPEDDDGDVNNLTGNQLRAQAEATVTVPDYTAFILVNMRKVFSQIT